MIALSRRRSTATTLARRLESLGHCAEHVADCGLSKAPDDEIRNRAQRPEQRSSRKTRIAIHRLLRESPPVVWVRIGNTRRAVLLERFETELAAILAALERGEAIVELT